MVRSASAGGRPGDAVVPVVVDVRVVDAGRGDGHAADLERVPRMRGVEPPAFHERGAQVAPGQAVAVNPLLPGRDDIARGVLERRAEVVVAAEDEDPGQREQRVECREDGRDGAGVREVVAGVDDEVGLERGELRHPPLLRALTGGHVQVREVQHTQRTGAGTEDRQGRLAERPPPPLDPGRVADRGRTGGDEAECGPGPDAHRTPSLRSVGASRERCGVGSLASSLTAAGYGWTSVGT